MTLLQLAKQVWGNLGQTFESLSDGSREAELFSASFDQCARVIIYKTAPQSFIHAFKPALRYDINADNNPFKGEYYVFHRPNSLIQIINNLKGLDANFLGIGRNSDVAKEAFDVGSNQKVLLSKQREPTFVGIILSKNLNQWNPQLLECLILYMAWYIANSSSESNELRARLKQEYMASMDEAKIYGVSDTSNERLDQSGDWAETIDFDLYNVYEDSFFLRNQGS